VAGPALFVLSTLVTVVAVATFGFLLTVASVRYRVAWALPVVLNGFASPSSAYASAANVGPHWTPTRANDQRSRSTATGVDVPGIFAGVLKTHVSNILMKLELDDRTQAALYAMRHTNG